MNLHFRGNAGPEVIFCDALMFYILISEGPNKMQMSLDGKLELLFLQKIHFSMSTSGQ